jgi:hypothetical protein
MVAFALCYGVLTGAAFAENCAIGSESELSAYQRDRVQVAAVVKKFMDIEADGINRGAHNSHTGLAYVGVHKEPIRSYEDRAVIAGYDVLRMCPILGLDEFEVTLKLELLAIYQGGDDNLSQAEYSRLNGDFVDPRVSSKNYFQCGGGRVYIPSDKYYFINIRLEKIAKHWLITNGTDWREMMSLAGVRKDLAFRVKQMIGLQKLRGEYGDLARANNRLRQECDQKLIEIFGMTGTGNK